jgi:hypothetical protein
MASATRDGHKEPGGVEFIRESDGTITAQDVETGLARGGETRAEALSQLAEVLALENGEGEPIADEDAFLEGIGLDSEKTKTAREKNDSLPDFMQ